MSAKRIDLQSIQFGTLNNGVFEKAEAEDKISMDSSSYGGKLHMKKYNSSVLWYLLIILVLYFIRLFVKFNKNFSIKDFLSFGLLSYFCASCRVDFESIIDLHVKEI